MPNKTIYVSDEDLRLFERAQELAGSNLSSAIVRALRRFIELEEARLQGFDEIIVVVTTQGMQQRKRFVGQRLLRWFQAPPNGKGTQVLNVYHTAGKRYVLHTRTIADWQFAWGDPEYLGDPKNWGVGNGLFLNLMTWGYDWETRKTAGEYSLQIFDTLADLQGSVPADLYAALLQASAGPEIEDLDI